MRKYYSLIDKVYRRENLQAAFAKVKANKGAPGIDGETVGDFARLLAENINNLHEGLKTNTYVPQPVRRTYIEKPDGGKRPLGIPTVRDRVVQQALLNVLEPIFEPDFHPSSYGYRPGRSPQQAVAKAERFMNKYGLKHVVDMDLSKCFDTLDHELILEAVNRRVSDGRVLGLIRGFLKTGVMEGDKEIEPEQGSPQGGVISPLLANIYLNEFDQKMKEQGIRIVRFADDILILAGTRWEAGRFGAIARNILEKELKLKVNQEKTHLTSVNEGVPFLGFIIKGKWITIHPTRIKRFKEKIRKLTPRNHGKNVEEMVKELNPVLRGWANYFRIANCKGVFSGLMAWTRRRLRMKKMKEWKTWKPLHKQLRRRGYNGEHEKISVTRWRNSNSPLIHYALPNQWFDDMKLVNLETFKVGVLHLYYEI